MKAGCQNSRQAQSLAHNSLAPPLRMLQGRLMAPIQLDSIPGGVLGPKNDGGVPLAAENWTQKDRGKNEIWGLKDRIL